MPIRRRSEHSACSGTRPTSRFAPELSTLAELLAGCALRKVGHVLVVLVCLIGEADAGEGVIGEVLESVAAAFEGVDVGVVDDAVDHGGGDGLVAEDLSPAGEG